MFSIIVQNFKNDEEVANLRFYRNNIPYHTREFPRLLSTLKIPMYSEKSFNDFKSKNKISSVYLLNNFFSPISQ